MKKEVEKHKVPAYLSELMECGITPRRLEYWVQSGVDLDKLSPSQCGIKGPFVFGRWDTALSQAAARWGIR